ncbi:hypothetical protein E4U42_005179 [Claviceps africana]|uniref:Peptidase M43 pregnancy-associated plasma-A domain-containing protein n=1 Tax=Claviceps africana TaxID=83212 RepID=A0A8K0J521_9HYPO|nr:hypothetical protein E4U42_005179 [Claviceps africana]
MSLRTALTLGGLIATAAAAAVRGSRSVRFGCGTGRPTEELMKASRELQAEEWELAARDGGRRDNVGRIVVDTYVHVVAKDETVRGGYISAATVAKQIEVLRQTYSPVGVSFVHKDTSWTVDPSWAVDNNEEDMKRTLRRGTYRDLNLYLLKELSGPAGTLGYCNFPSSRAGPASRLFYLDGCNVHVGSVPGGPLAGFNLGKTATHEVGHWFGLMHTFEGDNCHGAGDHVDDTPAQASSSQGCPVGRDSCPDDPGPDPIHNYMDYSSDPCYEQFTPGQINRIQRLWHKYRENR